MRGVNKVILIGNLGRDPEVRYLPSGGAVATLAVATSESWKDKNTGQPVEHTEWHRVVFFSRLAEIAGEYLKKGSKVYIEGSLATRKWQDKQTGQDRYTTEIKGLNLQMLDSKGGGGAPTSFEQQIGNYEQDAAPYSGYSQEDAAPTTSHMAPLRTAQTQPAVKTAIPPVSDIDDDIPF